jgi:hypothetical protein
MASEARRIAKALVETRSERFESRHSVEESKARLQGAIATARLDGRVRFTPRWQGTANGAVLDAEFAPPPRTQRFLLSMSLAMTALVAASIWAVVSPSAGDALGFLLPLSTGLAILALPFVFVALGSNREAEEARIRKAIRVALLDEEERLPPAKKWDDEE